MSTKVQINTSKPIYLTNSFVTVNEIGSYAKFENQEPDIYCGYCSTNSSSLIAGAGDPTVLLTFTPVTGGDNTNLTSFCSDNGSNKNLKYASNKNLYYGSLVTISAKGDLADNSKPYYLQTGGGTNGKLSYKDPYYKNGSVTSADICFQLFLVVGPNGEGAISQPDSSHYAYQPTTTGVYNGDTIYLQSLGKLVRGDNLYSEYIRIGSADNTTVSGLQKKGACDLYCAAYPYPAVDSNHKKPTNPTTSSTDTDQMRFTIYNDDYADGPYQTYLKTVPGEDLGNSPDFQNGNHDWKFWAKISVASYMILAVVLVIIGIIIHLYSKEKNRKVKNKLEKLLS